MANTPTTDPDGPRRPHSGRLKVHPDGFGFVSPEDGSEEIFIGSRGMGLAMDGDRVDVESWVSAKGFEGRVLRIAERGRSKITGQLSARGKTVQLLPDDPRLLAPVVLRGGPKGGQPGEAVVAAIVQYPNEQDDTMVVEVIKVLGDPDSPATEIEKVLAVNDVRDEFPPDVARQAASMPDTVRPADLKDRADLRHVPFMTIDPETARDFDDAVALERQDHGRWRLWVAVADVSHYVRDDQPVDREAVLRGCSIYLPNRAIPMLPEALSSRMCSLVPEEDRLAMVVRIDFDGHGAPRDADFCAAVIHSRARLDYGGVSAALAGDVRGKRAKYAPVVDKLAEMRDFSRVLRERRMERGALDLDLPEPFVELDQDDPKRVRDVRQSRKDPGVREAYALIEEFMLAANEAVARSFTERKEDTLWRVHDTPNEVRLEDFAAIARSYGIAVDTEEAATPRGARKVLEALKGHPAEKALAFQLLRSLKQATYDIVNVGHFGLAAPHYLHFTSPIRRYPDLVVHRLLKRRLAGLGKPAGGFPAWSQPPEPHSPAELAAMAMRASGRERKVMDIEREVLDIYRTFFMRDRVGDELDGVVSGVTHFGIFVTVEQPFVEGLVRLADLPGDHYEFDERKLRLSGKLTGRGFGLGDVVKVKVASVSVARRKIDFALVGVAGAERASRREEDGHAPFRGTRGRRHTGHEANARAKDGDGRGARRARAHARAEEQSRPPSRPLETARDRKRDDRQERAPAHPKRGAASASKGGRNKGRPSFKVSGTDRVPKSPGRAAGKSGARGKSKNKGKGKRR